MGTSLNQILVHFDDSRSAVQRLGVARRLAGAYGGTVTALYAVNPSLIEVPFAVEAGAPAIAALREVDEQRAANARAAFEAALEESPGPRAHWAQVGDAPVGLTFAEQALYADLAIVSQHNGREHDPAGVPFDLVENTAMASGRPVLVIPYVGWSKPTIDDIAIAWKPTREAARALTAALPFMRKARSVHILSFGDAAREDVLGSRLDLDGWLRAHGIEASWHRDPGKEPEFIGDTILTRAQDLGCDLLVMGCYGHSRAREWVLGGASRTVLATMTTPVLIAH